MPGVFFRFLMCALIAYPMCLRAQSAGAQADSAGAVKEGAASSVSARALPENRQMKASESATVSAKKKTSDAGETPAAGKARADGKTSASEKVSGASKVLNAGKPSGAGGALAADRVPGAADRAADGTAKAKKVSVAGGISGEKKISGTDKGSGAKKTSPKGKASNSKKAPSADKSAEILKRPEWKALKLSDASPYETGAPAQAPANHIDVIVRSLHKSHSLAPANQASDAVLCRRLYLGLTGTLPTVEQLRAYLDDASADKRERLIDALMASDNFVDYWALKFGDIFRVKAEFPVNLWPNAAQAYDRFIRECIMRNVSYGEMARRMLCASGSNFRVGEVNFYRAMQSRDAPSMASSAALTFMGMRFEKLPREKRDQMSAFFSRVLLKSTKEWKEEVVVNDISKRAPFKGVLPDGWEVDVGEEADLRAIFAGWLTAKGNPYFSRAFANRAWAWIFGQPIVSPVDDMFADNPPVCTELLDFLGEYFQSQNFDVRKLFKLIAMSNTYSQSFIPRSEPGAARKFFAVYPVQRLDAEVIIDALCALTDSTEIYSSTTPEPYTTLPNYARAIALPDGSITTSFLELFGKPARDTGTAAERVNAANSSQKLHMVNSTHIRSKLSRSPKLRAIFKLPAPQAFRTLYLSILSREPTRAEAAAYLKAKPDWNRVNDLAWALVNTEEFINSH